MSVVVVGLNQRTVPLELLERMAVSPARLPKALHDLAGRDHITEVVVVSTCMRTEVYAVAERYHGAVQDVRNFLAELSFSAPEDFSDHLYTFHDEAAAAHLFRVASGLDSAVLGESEVLGQVRQAWERARAEGAAGPLLTGLFRHAVEVGKRARSETAISRGTTSVSHAAVAMAAEYLGSLDGRRILVLGTGDMGEGMASALRTGGARELVVASRTRARAEALAQRVGGTPVGLAGLPAALREADLLLTSTGAADMLISEGDVRGAMAARNGRPLLIVDIAVPRDVDPAVGAIEGVRLLDMDDLAAFAQVGVEARRREVPPVERIIDQEVDRYVEASVARQAAPLVAALRDRAESVRVAELERFRTKLASLDPDQRAAVEALTSGLVAKLLHEPTVQLKDSAGTPRGERLADALRALFDL